MINYHNNLIQGTQAWLDARGGILTASNLNNIITPAKLAYAKNDKARSHVLELAAQRVTGFVEPQFETYAMARGHEDEIYAREMYQLETKTEVQEVGFITQHFGGGLTLGYSPDGLVGEYGLIEIKSRCQKYQMRTIAEGVAPIEYMLQMQTGMLVSGRKWCDFVSYCQGMPIFVVRVMADANYAEAIINAAIAMECDITAIIDAYNKNAAGRTIAERRSNDGEVEL